MENNTAAVTTYNMTASNGRHIRKATKVKFSDGRVVRFIDLMGKKQAIAQAAEILRKEVAA